MASHFIFHGQLDWARLAKPEGFVLSRAVEALATTLSSRTAYGVLYGALISLALIAIGWTYAQVKINHKNPAETLLTARNSQKWWGITASFFSSAMGTWVLSAPAEVGATAGWWGVLGYAMATAVPWSFLAIFGPKMRELTSGKGFTAVDYIKVRLGRPLHVLYTLLSLGIVFLSFVIESVTIGSIFQTISPSVKPVVVTISLAAVVFVYTSLSGMRGTMLTDRIQFILLSCLIIIGVSAIYGEALPSISKEEIKSVGTFTTSGFVCLLVLNISCFFPTFMDPSSWSRMYAARSEKDARVGLLVAACLLMIPMIFFGSVGIVAEAAVRSGAVAVESASLSPFFALLTIVHPAWSVVLLIMATCLSASTIDTFSCGFATLVAAEIGERKLNFNWARLVALIVFVLALVTAIYNPPSVMTLFMVGNLLTTCTTPALLLSLWSFVTPIGCATGIVGAALSVCTFGWARIGTFKGGFEWWLLPEDYQGITALGTFIACGGTATILSIGVSQFEFWLKPGCRQAQIEKFVILKQSGRENSPSGSGLENSSGSGHTAVVEEKENSFVLQRSVSVASAARVEV